MSKLTDGFEDSDYFCYECGSEHSAEDFDKLLAHARALEAMLKRHDASIKAMIDELDTVLEEE